MTFDITRREDLQFTEVDYFEKVSKSNFKQAIYKLYNTVVYYYVYIVII